MAMSIKWIAATYVRLFPRGARIFINCAWKYDFLFLTAAWAQVIIVVRGRAFPFLVLPDFQGCCALHCGHFAAAIPDPAGHFKKLSGSCTKLPYFLLVAFTKAGSMSFLCMSIPHNYSKFYTYWHLLMEFTARYFLCYHFIVRPFVINDWTGGGAKESTRNQFRKRATGPKLKRSLPLISV